jgi:hypothetical protein
MIKKTLNEMWTWLVQKITAAWSFPKGRRNLILIAFGLVIISCCCFYGLIGRPTSPAAPAPAAIAQATEKATWTPYPTYTIYPTYSPQPTYTAWIILVTPAQTFTPVNTTTITQTPTFTQTPSLSPIPSNTLPPTKTLDPIYQPKSPGFYLVNQDIGPGSWRSQGDATTTDCYWEIDTKTGDIIDNYIGMAGGTIYIRPTDYQVQLNPECGDWIFLGK